MTLKNTRRTFLLIALAAGSLVLAAFISEWRDDDRRYWLTLSEDSRWSTYVVLQPEDRARYPLLDELLDESEEPYSQGSAIPVAGKRLEEARAMLADLQERDPEAVFQPDRLYVEFDERKFELMLDRGIIN